MLREEYKDTLDELRASLAEKSKELEAAKVVHSRNLSEVQKLKFKGDADLEEQIKANAEQIQELEQLKNTQTGLFKRRKISELSEKIRILSDQNESRRRELADKREESERIIREKTLETKKPIEALECSIGAIRAEIRAIEDKINLK